MTEEWIDLKDLKSLRVALRREHSYLAWFTIQMISRWKTTRLNPRWASTQIAVETSLYFIADLERRIEELQREKAIPGTEARRANGKNGLILDRVKKMICPRRERATLIATQLGLSADYVRRVLKKSFPTPAEK
jgi:hypothetical protein